MAYDKIIRLLNDSGIKFVIHEHEVIRTITDIEEKLPFPKEHLLKTVVFQLKDSFWILAAIKGQDRVDYRKLASAFEVKRNNLKCPSPEEVESTLGFETGGVGPFPISDRIKVVFDSSLLDLDNVYCGVGRNDRTLEITLNDLLQVSKARVLPLVQIQA